MDKNKSIKILLILSFIFLFFKIIAIYNSELGLHGDEAQYWVWSKELSWGYFSKPPLIAVIIRSFGTLLGDSIFAIKLISSIFYVFSSYVYRIVFAY